MFIGSDPDGEQRYAGLLQDVRLYRTKLSRSQIHELHAQPPKTDLRTTSGYLRYLQDERQKSFVVEVRDDDVEEGEEIFYLQLVAVGGGARLPFPRPTAALRVMKSDNANGLFGFTGTCIPDVSALDERACCDATGLALCLTCKVNQLLPDLLHISSAVAAPAGRASFLGF